MVSIRVTTINNHTEIFYWDQNNFQGLNDMKPSVSNDIHISPKYICSTHQLEFSKMNINRLQHLIRNTVGANLNCAQLLQL